ncbi:hypothetical protein [Segetibacter aerophilus]|uniref:Addiction module protein n=1 Tax=Segetibacter aerophilus TaxID=670293 RepID=A0A512BIF1_9BACT|nr:hypothetical protein [Segetibacter aerophilus]GEO11730.1 hypothetical protein SAE01_42260 [Segetibacter aerophilus]
MESIKEKLQEYINTGDDKLLKLLYAVAKEYTHNEDELRDDQIAELDMRRERSFSGASKGYNWTEAKKLIIGDKKINEL